MSRLRLGLILPVALFRAHAEPAVRRRAGAANWSKRDTDEASGNLPFQIFGSRLKPGCAQGKIIFTAVGLRSKSGK